MINENESLFITKEEAGQRLDKILSQRFDGQYSRTYFQFLIDSHLVLLNGEIVKKRTKPEIDDEVEIEFAITPEIQLTPENIPLSILYEDQYIIVIDKPPGMVVHPATGNWSGTLVNALLYYCKELEIANESIRPGIVHRLDKDTSGIIVAAKTLEAQQKMIALFASRKVFKSYLAITVGRPPDGEINEPIGRHPKDRKLMAILPNGREALSISKALQWNDRLSLVEVIILTGRTHQIRVHLKGKGTPVLGDKLYGKTTINQTYGAERQMLHAHHLHFIHPFTGKKIELTAPIPADFQKITETLLNRKLG